MKITKSIYILQPIFAISYIIGFFFLIDYMVGDGEYISKNVATALPIVTMCSVLLLPIAQHYLGKFLTWLIN